MNKNPLRSSPIIGIFVMTLLIATSALPLISGFDQNKYVAESISPCSFAWPPSLWNEVLYSGNGHWQERSVDGSDKDPYDAANCYAIADSKANPNKVFNVGLFTPSMDFFGETMIIVECGISLKLDVCNNDMAMIRVYSGGTFQETIGSWDSSYDKLFFSVTIYPDSYDYPSDVSIEFYYTTGEKSDCGFFSIDNVEIYSAATLYIQEDFGYCSCRDPIELIVGECDLLNPQTPIGGEPTNPSYCLREWIYYNYYLSNPGAQPGSRKCDEIGENQYWAHTFDLSIICPGADIVWAELIVSLRNDDTTDQDSDHIKIGCIEGLTSTWDYNQELPFNPGDAGSFTMNLGDISGLLDKMNNLGFLDVAVDDDSPVDCAKLKICCGEAEEFSIAMNKYAEDYKDVLTNIPVGTPVEFTIEVAGTGGWDSLVISDDIPPCLQYVVGSATPSDSAPGVDLAYGTQPGSDLTWFIVNFQANQYYEFSYTCTVVCLPPFPFPNEISNFAETTATIGSQQEVDSDEVIIKYGVPDLYISGSISWNKVKPGETITDSFIISNSGIEGSNLNWKVAEYPDWGTWTFTPSSGTNLKPEEGPVEVEVEVEAPDEEDKEFSGEIKIVNVDDPEDYEIVPVSLSTPINPDDSFFIYFIKKIIHIFPVLESLLGPILDGL